jgi:hypothetical protein
MPAPDEPLRQLYDRMSDNDAAEFVTTVRRAVRIHPPPLSTRHGRRTILRVIPGRDVNSLECWLDFERDDGELESRRLDKAPSLEARNSRPRRSIRLSDAAWARLAEYGAPTTVCQDIIEKWLEDTGWSE